MYYGSIITVLSSDKNKVTEIAEKLGKLHETAKTKIYYRKKGEYIRSILLTSEYPERIIDLAEALSLSSTAVLYIPETLTWMDGELALLIDSLNTPNKIVISNLEEGKIKNILGSLSTFTKFDLYNDISDLSETKAEDKGVIYIDRVFTVKGVGTVVTGFSFTNVEAHEKLVALPYNKEVEIKSIQVLDEDQKSVSTGVRVGFALKNVKEEEIEDLLYLVKPNIKVGKEIEGQINNYKWSTINQGQNHIIVKGHGVAVNIKIDKERAKVISPIPIPIVDNRISVLNVNVKQGKPRVAGYINL
ncbi:translation elongation factor [Saccharolobus solfataricus]|uniref:Translation elongation factor n=2 Tax=Saccharolobus solfataricus TaxID=2287 RepID=A0A0E3JXJ8_SACSO|nr:translation elongation factor [Saccharolobus solfataricus]AKA73770.1 translation elongation factor [Saccharolobus solfataricus]AKA76467.1 translation elongation factor [Saccharolobus solfataricus]AKA79160.1 translation elongation factor [Saccharolobus solfataricus]AZF68243.1 translation elongation factor [Saccharolobus solfataricus]AZF70863.1 translation elongation factor [Saccharolobus solfataricus]